MTCVSVPSSLPLTRYVRQRAELHRERARLRKVGEAAAAAARLAPQQVPFPSRHPGAGVERRQYAAAAHKDNNS